MNVLYRMYYQIAQKEMLMYLKQREVKDLELIFDDVDEILEYDTFELEYDEESNKIRALVEYYCSLARKEARNVLFQKMVDHGMSASSIFEYFKFDMVQAQILLDLMSFLKKDNL